MKKNGYSAAKDSCENFYNNMHLEYFDEYSDELIKKPYEKDFLNQFIALLNRNEKILDVGCCSTAQQARHFYENGFQVTSIDLSKNCIDTARQNYPHIDFRQMDMTEMDFEHNSFDGINAFYSIIHIPDEKLDNLFLGFNKVLKINGAISITVHAGDFYGYNKNYEIPVFYRTYAQNDLQHYLHKYGFEIIKITQRQPIYDFEFQSERIYLIAKKIKNINASG